ncbi:glycosyltransferase family 4 protein [Raoultella ornithinolytica]|uniref:glycosyltransferase family 4 protein n=3 Tax=Raoultella ornithinolytica TaxID=54291 RepID=UPI00247ACD92|nr:glycosyltransferase family 4 protein [Raoultella ornithinolytica]MDH7608860.1 glycosyltransferase family 4 protein [Raoultella ornithinolytica]HDH7845989.1 glycosyltransferase family 4 protein [Raoultella ornithinolytica]
MSVIFIQPYLTKYRLEFFQELSELLNDNYKIKFKVVCGVTPESFGKIECANFDFEILERRKKGVFYYFKELSKELKGKNKTIIHFGDFKYISLYQAIISRFTNGNMIFLHGQGGYKRKSVASKIIYNLTLIMVDGYICYNSFCAKELKSKTFKFLHNKIHHIDNTLYLTPVNHSQAYIKNREPAVVFIGRVRERSGIEFLLEACEKVRSKIEGFKVHIIGSGAADYISELESKYVTTVFHGPIYSQHDIKKISESCLAGVYGGDAGLSVVHYMSLGLPVIVHNDIYQHMGPEPAYIKNMHNGLLFERDNNDDLVQKIILLCENNELVEKLSLNSLLAYDQLSKPSMASKLVKILKREID